MPERREALERWSRPRGAAAWQRRHLAAQAGQVMIDPVPADYVGLDEAVARLAADTSDREVLEELKHRLDDEQVSDPPAPVEKPSTGGLAWAKRELAIRKLHAALRDGALIGFVRHPVSGEWFRLTGTDWHSAVFWREILIGGAVRAAVGEEIARHEGRRVLVEASKLEAWLKMLMRCRPQPAEVGCAAWLEAAMRASPQRRPKPKGDWREEAKTQFGVSGNQFDRIWDDKLKITGATWGEAGAPSKPPR